MAKPPPRDESTPPPALPSDPTIRRQDPAKALAKERPAAAAAPKLPPKPAGAPGAKRRVAEEELPSELRAHAPSLAVYRAAVKLKKDKAEAEVAPLVRIRGRVGELMPLSDWLLIRWPCTVGLCATYCAAASTCPRRRGTGRGAPPPPPRVMRRATWRRERCMGVATCTASLRASRPRARARRLSAHAPPLSESTREYARVPGSRLSARSSCCGRCCCSRLTASARAPSGRPPSAASWSRCSRTLQHRSPTRTGPCTANAVGFLSSRRGVARD